MCRIGFFSVPTTEYLASIFANRTEYLVLLTGTPTANDGGIEGGNYQTPQRAIVQCIV
jgi:hypothetical protein